MKALHVINPVAARPDSDLAVAQPITFESLRVAKSITCGNDDVRLVTAQYPEDHIVIPNYFEKMDDLRESVLDHGHFPSPRKLPLIREILEKACSFAETDYLIYSNVDIAVIPHFYSFVFYQIRNGLEAFVINRRTIPSSFTRIEELPVMYSCIGEQHPGYDCFIFRRELIERMSLHCICIGAPYVGLALYVNLRVLTKRFCVFEDEHLTFHIGNEKAWKSPSNQPFADHNRMEFEKIRADLSDRGDIDSIVRTAFPVRRNVVMGK